MIEDIGIYLILNLFDENKGKRVKKKKWGEFFFVYSICFMFIYIFF